MGSPKLLHPDFLAKRRDQKDRIPDTNRPSGAAFPSPSEGTAQLRELVSQPLTLRALWDVPLGLRLPPSSSCISEHSSSSSSSMMSERSDPRLLSVWYSSPWQQCGWGQEGDIAEHHVNTVSPP